MQSVLALPLLLSLAAAQDLPIDAYASAVDSLIPAGAPWGTDNYTNVVTEQPSTVAAQKRTEPTACIDQVGNGPHVVPDTDTAFLAYSAFSAAATAAAANPPDRFHVATNWINLQGSNGDNTGYLTYISSQLASYDPDQCAAFCEETTNCVSFVIYYERDPELVWPTTYAPEDPACPGYANSSSVTLVKCAFYSVPLYAGNATNVGQYQDEFHLVVAGSTAFNLEAPTIDGWTGPVDLEDAALNIPTPVGAHGYIRVQTFPNSNYDPDTCATNCQAITAYNARHGSSEECTSFNAYVLYENGVNGYVSYFHHHHHHHN